MTAVGDHINDVGPMHTVADVPAVSDPERITNQLINLGQEAA